MRWHQRWFRRKRTEERLDAELRFHIEQQIADHAAAGMKPEEARRRARLDLGGIEQVKEECRDVGAARVLEALLQDLLYGVRQLRRNPGFTAVAVITLALGIGASAAIFSVVNAVLLRPLPFKNPSRLVELHEGIPKLGFASMGFSPPDLEVFKHAQTSYSAIGVFRNEHVDLSGQGEPERVMAARVSASLFPMLGAKPLLGRTFTTEEDVPGRDVAILSYALWQHRYGGDADVLGRTIPIDRVPYAIIGVMPRNFEFPLLGPHWNGAPAALWVPMALTPTELQDWGGVYLFSVVGRLRPGVTLGEARSLAELASRRILERYPPAIAVWARRGQLAMTVSRFQDDIDGRVRSLLLVLMGAVAFLLLITCANVATLLLSRAATRRREMAVRSALGATKLRLTRQMLTESLLLALAGGAFGLIVAFYGRTVMLALVPATIPLPRHVPLSASVLFFALAASVLAAVLFGLAPALMVSGASVHGSLQEGGRRGTADGSHRAQRFFVRAEFALALVLLVGAGLLIRSLGKLLTAQPGFQPDHLLTMNIPLPRQAYPQAAEITDFYKQLLHRVSHLPGVESAGLSTDLPLHAREGVSMIVEGETTRNAIVQSWVLGPYFETMRIPVVQGRWFTPEDRQGSQPVVVVSLSATRKFWPGQSAVGKRIKWGVYAPWDTVIGVVGNVSQGPLSQPLAPHVYRPYLQALPALVEEDPFADLHSLNLAVRTHVASTSLTPEILAQVHSLDPDLAVANIQTMTQVIRSSLAGPQFDTILIGIFAGLALFLAALGVYGVLAYAVAQRTHEIGIRMALGANKKAVLRMVLRQGMFMAAIGMAIGWVGSLAVTRALRSLLYDVKPTDPVTFAAVSLVLAGVALVACYIPARRAANVDPMVALRQE